MQNYLFKFDEPYEEGDSDVFAKGCIEKSDNFIPIFIYGDSLNRQSMGRAKIDFDDKGVFYKEGVVYENVRIGFIVEQCHFKDNMRIIEKCKILELFIEK